MIHATNSDGPASHPGTPDGPRDDTVRGQLEVIFRAKRSTLIAALTRGLGPRNLDIIEAALQDAFVEAAESWPATGVPQRPDAWLITVARNRALDHARRQGRTERNASALGDWDSARTETAAPVSDVRLAGEIKDEDLRMMFVACHPCNSVESQIALTLRTLCGMEIDEIARALLSDAQAVAKRLVRARQNLRDTGVEFDLPPADDLPQRLPSVMKVIYLLFNEGYSSLRGERQIREELCSESIRLGEILAGHPMTSGPRVDALVALMMLQASRLAARTDEVGALLTLADQDRARWDRALIGRGLRYLHRSASGNHLSEYHMEAAIAACHATAATFADTDWTRVVACYDTLLTVSPTPIAAFNRAVAIGFGGGPEQGLAALDALGGERALKTYFPYHMALGEFEARAERVDAARARLSHALSLAGTEAERTFVRKRIAALPR
jgi:RNA polymerase sigma factor (sigma-70 family)